MNYKKAKHFREDLNLRKIILTANFYYIFQLKSIKILDWVLLKRKFSNQNLKIRVLPIKLLRNYLLFNFKLLNKIHSGNILMIYSKNFNQSCINIPIFKKNIFLIPLYIFFKSRFYLFENFQMLTENNYINLSRIMLQSHKLLKLLINRNL